MDLVQEDADGNTTSREENSNDERETDFGGDEGFKIGGEGQARLKKVL